MRNSWLIIFWQRIRRLLEHTSSKVWENCRGLESGTERGGIGSVIEIATVKEVYKKKIILRLDSLKSCKSFDSFNLKASIKIMLVYFFLVTRSIFSCCFWGFVVPLFCSQLPNVKHLSFWSEIFKRLLGEAHVFRRTFIFCIFPCSSGALKMLRHVVDLSVPLTVSRPPETT